jgi:hypothetical protein
VATCQIMAGRRPRGRALTALVNSYRRAAGLDDLVTEEAAEGGSTHG